MHVLFFDVIAILLPRYPLTKAVRLDKEVQGFLVAYALPLVLRR
jgi:hypothetical protein